MDLKKHCLRSQMVLLQIESEIIKSRRKHGKFKGSHEGYAVILEELDELWDEIKKPQRDLEEMRAECIQIAAMAIKFIEDICEQGNRR
jgi:NTP pyrophosphatase (non-canonical NTP hydrolase)